MGVGCVLLLCNPSHDPSLNLLQRESAVVLTGCLTQVVTVETTQEFRGCCLVLLVTPELAAQGKSADEVSDTCMRALTPLSTHSHDMFLRLPFAKLLRHRSAAKATSIAISLAVCVCVWHVNDVVRYLSCWTCSQWRLTTRCT